MTFITEDIQADEQRTILRQAMQQATDAILITDARLDSSGPRIIFANTAFCQIADCRSPLLPDRAGQADRASGDGTWPALRCEGGLQALFGACNGSTRQPPGASGQSLITGQMPRMFQGKANEPGMVAWLLQALQRSEALTGETINYRDNGSPYYVEWHISPIRNRQGSVTHFVSVQRDVTERRQIEALERDRRTVLESMVSGKALATTLQRIAQMLERQRPQMRVALQVCHRGNLRYTVAPNLPAAFADTLENHPVGPDAGPAGVAAHLGQAVLVNDPASPCDWTHWQKLAGTYGLYASWAVPIVAGSGTVLGAISLYDTEPYTPQKRDRALLELACQLAALAIDQRHLSDQLAYHALYDSLTGLPNRTRFLERLQQALDHAQQEDEPIAVCVIDLDRFKQINDTLGHAVGDRLLAQVAHRFQGCLPDHHTLARMAGDDFTLMLTRLRTAQDAVRIAQRLLTSLETPFLIDGRELFLSASVGISFAPQDGSDVTTLLKHADRALDQAQFSGASTIRCFAPEMSALALERLELEQQLRRTLERGGLVVYYQPQLDIASGAIVGMEALLRWQHPERGLIPPDAFIPLAEESGLIVPIGAWVLKEVCQQAAAWQQAGGTALRFAVNVSALQLARDDFVASVAAALDQSGLPPHCLELEITESAMMRDRAACIRQLGTLRTLGVRFSIDDFGTGYSSLAYLQQLPIDGLKIDRSFVRALEQPGSTGINATTDRAALVIAIVTLAHNFGLRVTAEGVETSSQLAFLRQIRCDEAQGYLIGRPAPASYLAALFSPTPDETA